MIEKKKICFVVSSPFTATVFLLKHFEYLSNEFEVYLVANLEGKHVFESKYVKQIKDLNIRRGISIIDDFKAIFRLKKYFKENNFDAVHSVTPKAGLLSMIASKFANVKIRIHIFTGQVWHTKSGNFRFILKQMDKLIVFCATHILVDGECQRQFLIQNKIVKEKNSKVLGKGSISGADEFFFVPNNLMYKEHRDKLGIKDEVLFLFLARITYDKGIIDLVNAFVKLNSNYSNTKLLIIGPDEDNLVSKIIEITKNKDVIIKGTTNKLLESLQVADVVCLPSYREGFGTVVIQASLLEKPVICSDNYGLMETIIDGETGLRHKVGDVESILEQMKKIMDTNLRDALGKNGRRYVIDNFSAEIISSKWLEFYKMILA